MVNNLRDAKTVDLDTTEQSGALVVRLDNNDFILVLVDRLSLGFARLVGLGHDQEADDLNADKNSAREEKAGGNLDQQVVVLGGKVPFERKRFTIKARLVKLGKRGACLLLVVVSLVWRVVMRVDVKGLKLRKYDATGSVAKQDDLVSTQNAHNFKTNPAPVSNHCQIMRLDER